MQSSRGSDRDRAGDDERGTRHARGDSAHGSAPPPTERSESSQENEISLEDVRAELAAAEDRHLRARADLENYRKRVERELERRLNEQRDVLLRDWLEVVDTVERAVALELEHPQLGDGLHAVLEQMESILARQGVMRVGEVGEQFDPERHEAIAVVSSPDETPGSILELDRAGYAVGDRLLRPAQVAVARAPSADD